MKLIEEIKKQNHATILGFLDKIQDNKSFYSNETDQFEHHVAKNGKSVIVIAPNEKEAVLLLIDVVKQGTVELVDEERFNDEDPLWFSETAHRISPITTLKNFETSLQKKLSDANLDVKTQIILVKTNGNIINAEDMLSIWEQMNAWVARSSFGLPEELPSFTEVFPKDLAHPDEDVVEKVEAIVKK